MAYIEAHLSTTVTESDAFPGSRVITYQGSAQSSAAAVQVVYDAITTGDFSVTLQAGFRRSDDAISFAVVATVTQTDVNNAITLTISPGLEYKFVHGSGVDIIAMIG